MKRYLLTALVACGMFSLIFLLISCGEDFAAQYGLTREFVPWSVALIIWGGYCLALWVWRRFIPADAAPSEHPQFPISYEIAWATMISSLYAVRHMVSLPSAVCMAIFSLIGAVWLVVYHSKHQAWKVRHCLFFFLFWGGLMAWSVSSFFDRLQP